MIASVKDTSLYDHVHRVLAHSGKEGMEWHRTHSHGAAYTRNDAKAHRQICQACILGTMHQASTDHLRVHRTPASTPGHQFALDAYTHREGLRQVQVLRPTHRPDHTADIPSLHA